MAPLPDFLTPEMWLNQIFSSQDALRGGTVKRKIRDIERLVGRARFLDEVERRGFQAVENNAHIVIFCNGMPVRRMRR